MASYAVASGVFAMIIANTAAIIKMIPPLVSSRMKS